MGDEKRSKRVPSCILVYPSKPLWKAQRRNGIEAFSDLETVKELDLAGYLSPGLVETISETKR